jgi:hypothetical protein
VDDAFFAKKSTSSTILTFVNYESKDPNYEDECNLNKAKALLHPSVLNDNFHNKSS